MSHKASRQDREFCLAFEAFEVDPGDFDHRAHVRLAYVYLCTMGPQQAAAAMKESLLGFLEHLGADPGKFHETMTQAWVSAVRHFMDLTEPCSSFEEFIEANASLLNAKIMLSHYSAEVLFSDAARARFIAPDVAPIPGRGE